MPVEASGSTDAGYKKKSFNQRWFGGQKFSLRGFSVLAAVVLFFNVGWLIWAKERYGISDDRGTIQQGDCKTAKRVNLWLHLLINVLSTTLLAGSNAFIQAFSSPTREEIDRAHAQGKWLHIGIINLRNFAHISWRKWSVCIVLAASSIPFHLLYNSLIFVSLSTHHYTYGVVTPGFLTGSSFNATFAKIVRPEIVLREIARYSELQEKARYFERLENAECIGGYASSFQTSYRDLVLVSTRSQRNTSLLAYGRVYPAYEDSSLWICPQGERCDPNKVNPTDWHIEGYPVDYCLAEKVPEQCSVQFSFAIMQWIIAFNVLKLVAMLLVLFRYNVEQLLSTVGDAAASFLVTEDSTTHHMCLASRRNIRDFYLQGQRYPRPYPTQTMRWSLAASRARWILFSCLTAISLGLVLIGLAAGMYFLKSKTPGISASDLWDMGFGTITGKALLWETETSVVKAAVTVNTPQLLLAILWSIYNSIVCSMFIAEDWSLLATKANTLMVSSPVGKQRGSWLLGLPMTFGILLTMLHVLGHWIVSQSIFMVQADIYDSEDGTVEHMSDGGYSPIAIILALVVGVLIYLSAVGLGFRKFNPGSPPVVSTCSAAISGAIHPGIPHDERTIYEEVRWAEVGPGWSTSVGHCSIVPERYFGLDGVGFARIPRTDRLFA